MPTAGHRGFGDVHQDGTDDAAEESKSEGVHGGPWWFDDGMPSMA